MQALHNAKQKEDKSLQDYTKQFFVTRDVLDLHIGSVIIFTKLLANWMDNNKSDIDQVKKAQKEELINILHSLHGKFRSIQVCNNCHWAEHTKFTG